jgi:hypothetical protein
MESEGDKNAGAIYNLSTGRGISLPRVAYLRSSSQQDLDTPQIRANVVINSASPITLTKIRIRALC